MAKKYNLIAIGRAALDLNAVEYNRPMEATKSFAKFVGVRRLILPLAQRVWVKKSVLLVKFQMISMVIILRNTCNTLVSILVIW